MIAAQMRACFISVNLFSLLCSGNEPVTAASEGSITRYGGPIAFLFLYSLFLFYVLVQYDSGTILPRRLRRLATTTNPRGAIARPDVEQEARGVAGTESALRVLRVSKAYEGQAVVEDVSFGVDEGTVMALLGPNGAGKTTTFNMIRGSPLSLCLLPSLMLVAGGDVIPTTGQILINGTSVIARPQIARLALGVCPQFTAIDAQLSVAEHLHVYGRLKGLHPGSELDANVEAILLATRLDHFRDRDAGRLSGGNQRKLALAIALMGGFQLASNY